VNHRLRDAFSQGRHQRRAVADVPADDAEPFPSNALHTLKRFGMAVAEIIEDGNVVSSLK
jgi:hypothetical protein